MVVVMVVLAAAVFAVVTAAAFMAQTVQHVLNLVVCGITVLQHNASEL